MFPHTITVYNKYVESGVEKWKRTVITGVFWNSSKGALIRKNGIASVDGLLLIIPMICKAAATYKTPKDFLALENKAGNWTLQSGDTVVLGSIETEVVKSSKELQKYDDTLLITAVDTKDYGFGMKHWEVTGR